MFPRQRTPTRKLTTNVVHFHLPAPSLFKIFSHTKPFQSLIATHLQPRIASRQEHYTAQRCSLTQIPQYPNTLHLLHIYNTPNPRKPSASRRKRYVTSIKRSTHSNSSCPTPHLQVSRRNPHPHHIHLYQPDHRPRHRLSSLPTMQAAVHLLPPSAPSAPSRPDK